MNDKQKPRYDFLFTIFQFGGSSSQTLSARFANSFSSVIGMQRKSFLE